MLRVSDLTYRVGGKTILDGASVHIPAGHKVGVVGQNGAGKSTLLHPERAAHNAFILFACVFFGFFRVFSRFLRIVCFSLSLF